MLTMLKSATAAILFSTICKIPKDKKFYLILDNEMITHYKTAMHIPNKGRHVLKTVQLYSTKLDCISLFNYSRTNQTNEEYYDMLSNWLLHASNSP